MEMIFCPNCGTRFDPELRICPVCKAEVVPPKPTEKAAKPKGFNMPTLALPSLPDPTRNMHIVERPAVEGVLTGAIWRDVILGLLVALVLPGLVGWSLFSAMSDTQIHYLLAFFILVLPVCLDVALFVNMRQRYRYFAIGLGISTVLCVFGICIIGLLFAGAGLMASFRG